MRMIMRLVWQQAASTSPYLLMFLSYMPCCKINNAAKTITTGFHSKRRWLFKRPKRQRNIHTANDRAIWRR